MAFLEVNYYSNTLGMERAMNVILPETTDRHPEWTNLNDLPVLYLLHGMSNNHTSWQRKTRIERLARDLKLAIVMPSTDLGWYTNTTYGLNYFEALALELPQKVRDLFPQVSKKREKNFVAGLSMGGYGAWKLALGTENFSHAASLSGALYMEEQGMSDMASQDYWQGVFGELRELPGSKNDLLRLAQDKVNEGKKLPELYAWCGKQDFLFEANEYATTEIQKMGYDLTYETADGAHEWYYWDKMIERVLEWLPIDYKMEERLS